MDNNEKEVKIKDFIKPYNHSTVVTDFSRLEDAIKQQFQQDAVTEFFGMAGVGGHPSNRPMSLKRLQAMVEEGGLFFSTEMTRSDMEKRLGLQDHIEDGSCPLCDAGIPTKQKVLVAHEGNMISFDAETIEPCPTMPETFEGLEQGKMVIIDSISAARQMGMTETYAAIMKQREPKGEQKPLRFNKRGKVIR
ncbi:hypothetical protein M3_0107 [Lysinibacillus phage vB_LfM_LysYB1]|nr:hypothetical protein M3_0107 [Lysinibacillus phage vB_LfM_LysYB1]WAB25384.1 hypothetical protein M5_0206 [Lysinibacillus phage vB_LfM_LysYB2]